MRISNQKCGHLLKRKRNAAVRAPTVEMKPWRLKESHVIITLTASQALAVTCVNTSANHTIEALTTNVTMTVCALKGYAVMPNSTGTEE